MTTVTIVLDPNIGPSVLLADYTGEPCAVIRGDQVSIMSAGGAESAERFLIRTIRMSIEALQRLRLEQSEPTPAPELDEVTS